MNSAPSDTNIEFQHFLVRIDDHDGLLGVGFVRDNGGETVVILDPVGKPLLEVPRWAFRALTLEEYQRATALNPTHGGISAN